MKMTLTKTLIAVGAFALTGAAFADDQNMSGMNMPLTSQTFVDQAAKTDLKEIHLGELALQKSENTDVKSFAEHMIADHSAASKKLQAIALKEGLNFPDTNSMAWEDHTNWNGNWNTNGWDTNSPTWNTNVYHDPQMKTGEPMETANNLGTNVNMTAGEMPMGMNLEMLSGAQFDQAYAAKMVHGHEKAIALFESATNTLDDSALKKYATKMLPTLHHHLMMAENLQSKVGMMDESGMTNSMPRMQ